LLIKIYFFGFVQLAGYNYGAGPAPGDLRQAQLKALSLPNVGYSTAIDVGNFGDIHPKDKQTVASRLANSALAIVYGVNVDWKFPRVANTTSTTSGTTITVEVRFEDGSLGTGLTLTVPQYALDVQANICPSGATPDECGTPTVQVNDAANTVLPATAALTSDSKGIVLTATAPATGLKAVRTSYGRAGWPVTIFFNSNGLPVIPWYQ